jgi:hypothetical protein
MPYLILIKFKDGISCLVRMGETRNACIIFVGLLGEKKPFKRNKHRWKEDIKTKLKNMKLWAEFIWFWVGLKDELLLIR